MQRNFSLLLLLVCVAAFVLGVVELFKLRFEAGDVYPAYSSLRSDPLGSSALYESLARVPGISVSRDFRMTDELPSGRNIAYLHLAGEQNEWRELTPASFGEVDSFVKRGGRLVIAFLPQTVKQSPWTSIPSSTTKGKKTKGMPKDKKKSAKNELPDLISLKEKWGVDFGFTKVAQSKEGTYETLEVENDDEPSLPASISWHSGMVFQRLDPAWRVIYSRGAEAVLIERKFGSGSVVLSSDSFFLSNEALENDRHAELLAWIVGPCREVVFDEAHLGIVDNPGIATLVRKYRLHGLVAGLLLLAALFIWKNSVSFVPAHSSEDAEAYVTGKDSSAGFINLLRRHIHPRDVLATCLVEWKKSFPKGRISTARLQRVQAVIDAENARPPGERHPVKTYQAICQALKETGTPH